MTYLTQVGGTLSLSGALGYFSSNYISQSSKNSANRGILWIGRNVKTISLLIATAGIVILVVNYAKNFFMKAKTIEEQLKELFKSKIPIKKLLVIDKIEIHVIFQPNQSSIINGARINTPVILIAKQKIDEEILNKISAFIPKNFRPFSITTIPLDEGGREVLERFELYNNWL